MENPYTIFKERVRPLSFPRLPGCSQAAPDTLLRLRFYFPQPLFKLRRFFAWLALWFFRFLGIFRLD
jgi:hypothetical protein